MRQFSKIWIYDNVIIGNNHIAINSAWTQILIYLLLNYGKEEKSIQFFGEQQHLDTIKASLSRLEEHINFKGIPIENIDPKGGIKNFSSWIKKWKKDKQQFTALLKKAKTEHPDFIFLTTLVASNYSYFFKQIKQHSDQQFFLMIHGEIEHVFLPTSRIKSKINAKLLKNNLKKIPQNLTLICLNEATKNALVEAKLVNEDQIILIPHPLPEKGIINRDAPKEEKIKIVHLGAAYRRKNAQLAFQLSQTLPEQIELILLGKVEKELLALKHGRITFAAQHNQSIPQVTYEKWIKEAHYAISFTKEPEYVYRISGALLDTLIFELPIIALQHPAIQELFDLGGDIGFICKDELELQQLLQKIANREPAIINQYLQQVENIRKLKAKFQTQNLATLFYKQAWKH